MIAYNVLNDVLQLRDIVDDFFKEAPTSNRRAEYPYIELYEGSDELEVRALMPGVKVDDLNLELAENTLYIKGKKESDRDDKAYLRKERNFGSFNKAIQLPYKVDANTIKAELLDGILHVWLLKSEDVKPKKITIN